MYSVQQVGGGGGGGVTCYYTKTFVVRTTDCWLINYIVIMVVQMDTLEWAMECGSRGWEH